MMRRRVGYTGTIFGSDLWAAAWREEREKEGRKVSMNKERRLEGVSMVGRGKEETKREREGGERRRGEMNILETFLLAYNLVAPPSLRLM